MPESLKLNEDIASAIRLRAKSIDLKTVEKLRKAKEENGTFDVIISTELKDRAGEIVKQDGWDLANYKNNPIVLWGHDYYSLPIGICTDTYQTTYRGVPALGARGVFLPAEVNPLAQQVRRLYEYGVKTGHHVGCTTSVGFIPKEFDQEDRSVITRAELLEFSFVDVPANQGVGPAQGRSITFEEAKELGLDVHALTIKGLSFAETRGYIPKDVSDKKAPIDTPWKKPTLEDFTDKAWDDLSDAEKRHIAGHYAYSKDNPPASFGDLKLPHHRASDGAVVWNGVKAAMGALMGARGGVDVDGDKEAVYKHLAAHYKEFDKEPPEFKSLKEAQAGDACSMDDGTAGVLASDPKDPDGPLVCLPQDQDKAKSARGSEKDLHKALKEEHERHASEIEDAFDAFREKSAEAVPEDQNDPVDANDPDEDKPSKKGKKKPTAIMREALKDLRDSVRDEHDMHRAKSIAIFRAFKPTEDKAFDSKEHLKALREEHDSYEDTNKKAMDDFEERCMKSVQGEPGSVDEHTDWVTGRFDGNQRKHTKAVTKIAKKMVRDAFGEEDQADEKVLEILKEHMAPFVPEQMQKAVFQKVGARISAATREKLREAHEHMKAATAIVEGLHGGLENDDGEEDRSDDGHKSSTTVPKTQRSRPSEDVRDDELNAHLLARDILRGITTAAQEGLKNLKQAKR